MTEKRSRRMVNLCRQIGTTYKAEERRLRQMPESRLATELHQDNGKPDFLHAVIMELSDLTSLKREGIAEYIFRATKRQSWSEWKLSDGTMWPDISNIAREMSRRDEDERTDEFISWLIETYPEKSHALSIISENQPDTKAPYMPSTWFTSEFGLTAEAMRKQVERGNLARKKIGHWNHYSVPDAQRIWPQDVIYGPPNKPES